MSSLDHVRKIVAITSFSPESSLQKQGYACEILTQEEFEHRCLANDCTHLFHDAIQYGLLIHHAEHYNETYHFSPQFIIVNALNNEDDEWSDTIIKNNERLFVEGTVLKKELQSRAEDPTFEGVGHSHFLIVCENSKIVVSFHPANIQHRFSRCSLSGKIFSFEILPNQFARHTVKRNYKNLHTSTNIDSSGGEI